MSLLVDVFVRDADGDTRLLDVPKGCSDMAGYESWRSGVWGSEVVRSLGARFFPVLIEGALEVEAVDLPEFLDEIALLRANLDQISAASNPDRTVETRSRELSSRLANIESAARRAQEVGGGVLIW